MLVAKLLARKSPAWFYLENGRISRVRAVGLQRSVSQSISLDHRQLETRYGWAAKSRRAVITVRMEDDSTTACSEEAIRS